MPTHGDRVVRGCCVWINQTSDYDSDVENIRKKDPFAWGVLDDQVQATKSQGGLQASSFASPTDYSGSLCAPSVQVSVDIYGRLDRLMP
jgi:hypothetical protein